MNTTETPGSKILVAYFSCIGTAQTIAEYAAGVLSAEIYEIKPEKPYTDDDLAYDTNSRAGKEQHDQKACPAISGSIKNIAQYDTILIGYPIWLAYHNLI